MLGLPPSISEPVESVVRLVNSYLQPFVDVDDSSLIPIATVAVVASFTSFVVGYIGNQKRLDFVLRGFPTPPRNIFLGHIPRFINGAWEFIGESAKKFNFKNFRVYIFGFPLIVLTDPTSLKRVLHTNFRNYKKDRLTYNQFLCILGKGIVTSEGDEWKRQRLLISAVMRVDILEEVAESAVVAADRLTTKMIQQTKENPEFEFDMAEEFRCLTLQVIGGALLSMTPDESDKVFPSLYLPIVTEANKRTYNPFRALYPTLTNLEFHRAKVGLNGFLKDFIRRRWIEASEKKAKEAANKEVTTEEKPKERFRRKHKDILEKILFAIDECPSSMVDQLCDEVKTFLLAGHETSSTMLTWAIFECVKNRDVFAKVREEVDELFKNGMPNFDAAKDGLQYTLAVLKETLRMYSVVPVVTRQCVETDKFEGFEIPSGVRVVIPMYVVHNRPDIWGDPENFRPDRFLPTADGKDPDIDPFAWIPFINGPRNCLGQHFSLLESKIVLGLLIRRFDMVLSPKQTAEKHPFIIPWGPKDGMLIKMKPRQGIPMADS
uniref:Cytochrome P450 n=1 Tax=Palpitomonas bilix TaxID=652834 RepID=A0A7S3CVE0_9EUKA